MSTAQVSGIRVKTLDGSTTTLDDAALAKLRARVRGPVLLPSDPAYAQSRSIWNGMIDRKPTLVVRASGTADVLETVRFARESNFLICVRAGGHNIAGMAVWDDAIMIDLTAMKGVVVDVAGKRATAQAGCTLGNLDRETQVHGLATVMGFVSLTGLAGLTLGGGFGYLTRKYGWASDNLLSAEVVTADGRVVRASESENADLFWGVRGGGGNYGVVTSFEFKLHHVGPRVWGGIMLYSFEHAKEVLQFYREMAAKAPRELTLVFLARRAPPAPWVPKDWHGKLVAGILACHTGSLDAAVKDLAPLKAFGKPVADILMERNYADLQMLLDGTQPNGRHYYWKSEWVAEISDGLVEKFLERAKLVPTPHCLMAFFQVGGAIAEFPADATAVGNRDAAFNLNIQAAWDEGLGDPNIAWARETWTAIRPFSTGGVYVNFLTEDEVQSRMGDAYKESHARLRSVKKKWDPVNFFRANQNIKPAD
jgi:FAD/FMN-containing dehydrogenase